MLILIDKLRKYGATNPPKIKSRQEVLDNAKRIYAIRDDIINAFESGILFSKTNKKVNNSRI